MTEIKISKILPFGKNCTKIGLFLPKYYRAVTITKHAGGFQWKYIDGDWKDSLMECGK